jgi:hypothetical protein
MIFKWIPITESLPKDDEYVLVSFENWGIPAIGRYERYEDGSGAFYDGDSEKTYLSCGIIANAWAPIPKCYREIDG